MADEQYEFKELNRIQLLTRGKEHLGEDGLEGGEDAASDGDKETERSDPNLVMDRNWESNTSPA